MAADLYQLIGPPSPEQARRLLLLLRLAPAQRAAPKAATPQGRHAA